MEEEIQGRKRKRVFDANAIIDLKPQTIKYIVGKLEGLYLFGIDADINGRLFETFLNATMRGKDLGQFFTPRSVVHLGIKMAMLRVMARDAAGAIHTDTVVDACCGSGGFLIAALEDMWRKVDANSSLSEAEKDAAKVAIANDHILGVDFGKEPPLARIARLNMYLHGDGGSRIFQADALDKGVQSFENEGLEIKAEKEELRKIFSTEFADVVLTNPPFAKTYGRDGSHEERVLDTYELTTQPEDGQEVIRQSLKSSVMFVERYSDILKPGGVLVTILDDSLLGGRDYRWFRDYVRQRFLVRAVISLPGDAFQRSNARVKTSLVVLQKRQPGDTSDQPSAFMFATRYVGIDDPSRQRTLSIDHVNREGARAEIELIEREYRAFLEGRGDAKYIISADRLVDRLDVKSGMYPPSRRVNDWKKGGLSVQHLGKHIHPVAFGDEDTVVTAECDDEVSLIYVSYDGRVLATDIIASDSKYTKLFRVRAGDIILSKINAVHGAIGIVPRELDGGFVTPSEYRVMRPNEGVDARLIWMLLRSYEARAEFLLNATGMGRTRVEWSILERLQLPMPDAKIAKQVTSLLAEADQMERQVALLREQASGALQGALELNNDEALGIVQAFKPPR